MTVLSSSEQLDIISKAWGTQRGYVFFPWIRGDAADKAQRIRGYNEGPAFSWPKDRDKIVAHLEAHKNDDVYWCPSIFEEPSRRLELAMDEQCLWADLDEVDPREIDGEFRPTIAWETSPGRYQALWLITSGDIQGASWPGNENQRLTYYLGADHSGWDTTQLLRVPGWKNHKFDYAWQPEEGGKVRKPRGRLLWKNGPRYLPDAFEDLPEVQGANAGVDADVLEDTIAAVPRLEVWGKVRLKVSKDVRELVAARSTGGQDRSEKLWQIERDLADAGCTVPEIVAIVRETVWNKFAGRNDELRRLVTEAAKAVAERGAEAEKAIEKDREDKPKPTNLFDMVRDAPAPVWLVKGILTKGACGFFAGEPKSFKSWTALDLALSVATGAPFLDAFDVVEPGPVLYIQEEDPLPTLKDRLGKIAPHKTQDRVKLGPMGEDGVHTLIWSPAEENDETPPLMALVRENVVLSDPGWQAYLDEILEEGFGGDKYVLLVVDTLGTTSGEVDENRAGEINFKVLTPLRQLAEKHGVAVQVVHHLGKSKEGDNRRMGQRLLGSVALHAWSESSLYFAHGRRGTMLVETESKLAASLRFEMTNLRKRGPAGQLVWEPQVNVADERDAEEEQPAARRSRAQSPGRARPKNDPPARTRSSGGSPRIGQGTRKKLARFLDLPDDAKQAEVREAWEAAGHTWGDWTPVGGVRTRDGEEYDSPSTPRRTNSAALSALKKLTAKKARSYTTHEIADKMAAERGEKRTQTHHLKAYQALKKAADADQVIRTGDKTWLLADVDPAEAAVEELAI